jgi:hypothetical protein
MVIPGHLGVADKLARPLQPSVGVAQEEEKEGSPVELVDHIHGQVVEVVILHLAVREQFFREQFFRGRGPSFSVRGEGFAATCGR